MNLIDIEDRLKDLSDQQLMQQMQRPDGTAPQFLVMSELKRRKEMRSNAPAPDPSTVKDDLLQLEIMKQGIGAVAPQQQQQPMPQGDGIPRYNNGGFLNGRPLFVAGPRRRQQKAIMGTDISAPKEIIPGHIDSGLGFNQMRILPEGAQLTSGRESAFHPVATLTEANLMSAGNMPTEGAASVAGVPAANVPAANVAGNANTPPSNQNYDYLDDYVPPFLGRMDSPSPTSSAFDGESTGATDYQRAVNQIMSAPSSSTPAEPPKNFYEDYEKKLKALYGVEDSGADAGMALLRAGLGMAQAGGEGKSTAAALGAGGIAGLDAYQASKKAKDDRAIKLLGVEGQLAEAQTQQAYNQQKLALDARMRDNQDKMLQLKGLNLSMEDDRIRQLASNNNKLKSIELGLNQQRIFQKERLLDETIRNNQEKIKATLSGHKALVDAKTATHKYWMSLNPEEKATLLPFIQKKVGTSTASNLDKNTISLFDKGGMAIQNDLTNELKREPTVQEVYNRAKEIVSGQRLPPRDIANIMGK